MIFLRYILTAHLKHAKNEMSKDFTRKHGLVRFIDFTGISSPFEAPVKPDIVVKTDEQTPDESIDYLFEQVKSKL